MTEPTIDATRAHLKRSDAVAIIPPGVTESRYQLTQTLGTACADAIDAAVAEGESFEILTITQDGYSEVVFTDGATQEEGDTAVLDRLLDELEVRLPDWIGISRGTSDLSSLGTAPLLTSQVVREPGTTDSLGSVFRSVLEHTQPQATATVCQLLCSRRQDGRFSTVARVATDSSHTAPIGRTALTTAVADPPADPLAQVLPAGYHSSRELVNSYWETRESPLYATDETEVLHVTSAGQLPRGELEEFVHASPAARRALTLASGDRAYDNLLRGRRDPTPYDCLDVEPTLWLSTATLGSLLSVIPHYGDVPVSGGGTRSSPTLAVAKTVREPVATPSLSSEAIDTRTPPSSLLGWVTQWCREQRSEVTAVENRSRGAPHLQASPHGGTAPVVIVDPSASSSDPAVSTAGELIMVANRAVRTGDHLLVVTPTLSAAQWAGEVLAVPYDRVLENGHTAVSTVRDLIPDGTGGFVVRSRASPAPTWSVTPGATRRLVAGDTLLAEGPLSTPLNELSYATPRFIRDGDQIVISHPDGATDCFDSVAACHEEYVGVPRPVCPVWPTFRGQTTILYRDGHRLHPHHPDTQWEHTPGPNTDLQTAIATFVATYTVRCQGAGATQFNQVLDGWLHDQLECQMPPDVLMKARLPSRISPKRNASGEITALYGCDWRIPLLEGTGSDATGGTEAAYN